MSQAQPQGIVSVTPRSTYLPRLDGIRGVAIGLVLIQHLAPWPWVQALGFGGIGVRLFFVLS